MNLFNENIKSEHEIKFLHFRKFNGFNPESNGGATVAYYEKDGTIYWAEARCSDKDNFSKTVGRIKSFGRLHSSNANVEKNTVKGFRSSLESYYADRYGYKRSFWGRMRKGQLEAGVFI